MLLPLTTLWPSHFLLHNSVFVALTVKKIFLDYCPKILRRDIKHTCKSVLNIWKVQVLWWRANLAKRVNERINKGNKNSEKENRNEKRGEKGGGGKEHQNTDASTYHESTALYTRSSTVVQNSKTKSTSVILRRCYRDGWHIFLCFECKQVRGRLSKSLKGAYSPLWVRCFWKRKMKDFKGDEYGFLQEGWTRTVEYIICGKPRDRSLLCPLWSISSSGLWCILRYQGEGDTGRDIALGIFRPVSKRDRQHHSPAGASPITQISFSLIAGSCGAGASTLSHPRCKVLLLWPCEAKARPKTAYWHCSVSNATIIGAKSVAVLKSDGIRGDRRSRLHVWRCGSKGGAGCVDPVHPEIMRRVLSTRLKSSPHASTKELSSWRDQWGCIFYLGSELFIFVLRMGIGYIKTFLT